jgi:HopA1 effector protein family
MATRPNLTEAELKLYTQKKKQQWDKGDPTVLRLFRFLDLVWENSDGGEPLSKEIIYDLYNGKRPPRVMQEQVPSDAPFRELMASFLTRAQDRSKECNGNFPVPAENFVAIKNNNLEFHTPCLDDQLAITDRVYINVKMERASDVLRFIVNDLVFGGRGVVYAKIGFPLDLCLPLFDRIVIYCGSGDAATRAAARVCATFAADCFNPETPAMTKVLSTGVSTGAEPRQVRGSDESFGSKRALAICIALRNCRRDKETFFNMVIDKFTEYNINPKEPHRNLP